MKKTIKLFLVLTIICMVYSFNDKEIKNIKTLSIKNLSTDSITQNKIKYKPQSIDERIKDIRKWYAQVQKIGKTNCITETKFTQDTSDPGNIISSSQKVIICNLSSEFQLIELDFSETCAGSSTYIYKRNGKIFFVFEESSDAAFSSEHRYYCDRDENVIRFLTRQANGGNAFGPQKTEKLNSYAPNIRNYISYEINEIQSVLKKKI